MTKFRMDQNDTLIRKMLEDDLGWECSTEGSFDVGIFTGGADINPELYGSEYVDPRTSYCSDRDNKSAHLYWSCVQVGTPMVGICRGSQFLWAMGGGAICQHIEGHGIAPPDGHYVSPTFANAVWDKCKVTSTHHQCAIDKVGDRYKDKCSVRSVVYHDSSTLHEEYFWGYHPIEAHKGYTFRWDKFEGMIKTPWLGVQWHPEYCDVGDDTYECRELFVGMANKLMNDYNKTKE